MGNAAKIFSGGINFNFGKYPLSVSFIQAGSIVFLIFLLIWVLAEFRRHFMDWSVKGALFGIFFGFLLALILEGFLIIGGKTALTSVLGWKNPPAPISVALDAGRNKLIEVLGINTQIPPSLAKENTTVTGAVELLQSLSPTDIKKVKTIFCQP